MTDLKVIEETKICAAAIEKCCVLNTNKSIVDSLNESIELSLPESFDDNVSEFLDPSLVEVQGAKGADLTFANRLLEAQLRTSEERLDKLEKEKEYLLGSLVEGINLSHAEIERIRKIPPTERSLFQVVALAFYIGTTKEASSSNIISDGGQEPGHQAAVQRNLRVISCDYQNNVVGGSGKALRSRCQTEEGAGLLVYDEAKKQHNRNGWQDLQDEIERLQKSLKKSQKELETAISSESEARSNGEKLQEIIDSLSSENQLLKKEKRTLLENSEKCEAHVITLERSLQEATTKIKNLMKENSCNNLRSNEDHITAATRDIKNIRHEFQNEISLYKKHVEKKFENQISVLKEANAEVVFKHEGAINEVVRLRNIVESIDNDKQNKILEIERQNADLRSAIKLKSIECARFKSSSKMLEEEVKECKTKLQLAHDEVMAHKQAFKLLETESLHERQRLKDEVQRKNEQLEAYYEVQEQNLSDTSVSVTNASKVTQLHLLDKTRSLTKKCKALQKQVIVLEEKLKQQDGKIHTNKSKGTNTHAHLRQDQSLDDKQHQEYQHNISDRDSIKPQDTTLSVEKARYETPEKVFKACQKYHYIMSSVKDSCAGNLKVSRHDNKWSTADCKSSVLNISELLMKHGVHHASIG